jgi:hypothetical protein
MKFCRFLSSLGPKFEMASLHRYDLNDKFSG